MNDPMPRAGTLIIVAALALGGCSTAPSPSATLEPTGSESATPSSPATPLSSPSATAEPPLSMALPEARDDRQIGISLSADLPTDGDGRITVEVTNLSGTRIDEIVLRWPTALRDAILLQPFLPSEDRIVDGGPPLRQEWSKWVEGPGAQGEPAGTTSLGYGPIDAGTTLTIPLFVTRSAAGPVAFDLQFLSGERLLATAQGEPAETRVDLP